MTGTLSGVSQGMTGGRPFRNRYSPSHLRSGGTLNVNGLK